MWYTAIFKFTLPAKNKICFYVYILQSLKDKKFYFKIGPKPRLVAVDETDINRLTRL